MPTNKTMESSHVFTAGRMVTRDRSSDGYQMNKWRWELRIVVVLEREVHFSLDAHEREVHLSLDVHERYGILAMR